MNNRALVMPARAALLACAAAALLGCASVPSMQTLDVIVEAADPAWSRPLACKATNPWGEWQFTAPGSVTVRPSFSPLRVSCTLPEGASAEPSVTPSRASASGAARERVRGAASTGAKVGGGAGAALGVAAVPIMGPAFAVLLAAGGALRGAEIGGLVGAVSSDAAWEYPSPIILRIKAPAPAAGVQPETAR